MLSWLNTAYNKLTVALGGAAVIGLNLLGGGIELGLTPVQTNWATFGLAVLSGALVGAVPNKNVAVLQQGQAVVNKAFVPASTPIVAQHKP